MKQEITLSGYRPGGLTSLCALQSAYYARDWGFDHRYEGVVAADMGEFLGRYDPTWDFIQLAVLNGTVEGGIVVDSLNRKLAQLHWFILSDEMRGNGVGSRLIGNAMDFVRKKGFSGVYLSTFHGLHAARRLYELAGFELTEEHEAATWGRTVLEQRFDWRA
ncbi:MAG: GNAT family N-acetyltransferase [Rhodospirillaceae bacterium]|nr:GNAT family N-acetyltransferase [Rhodospirillaceae bacterium]